MVPPLRKCSSDGCPRKNISPDLTWYCFCCKESIHRLCYKVGKLPEDIFVIDNITIVCDECLSSPKAMPSPKRKQPNTTGNLVQSTIDPQNPVLSLSKTVAVSQSSTPSKATIAKQSQQFQTVMETLVQKVDVQTATIEGLKSTVETLNEMISLQKLTVGESIKTNNEHILSMKKLLSQTTHVNRNKSYAETAKKGIAVGNGTPKQQFRM